MAKNNHSYSTETLNLDEKAREKLQKIYLFNGRDSIDDLCSDTSEKRKMYDLVKRFYSIFDSGDFDTLSPNESDDGIELFFTGSRSIQRGRYRVSEKIPGLLHDRLRLLNNYLVELYRQKTVSSRDLFCYIYFIIYAQLVIDKDSIYEIKKSFKRIVNEQKYSAKKSEYTYREYINREHIISLIKEIEVGDDALNSGELEPNLSKLYEINSAMVLLAEDPPLELCDLIKKIKASVDEIKDFDIRKELIETGILEERNGKWVLPFSVFSDDAWLKDNILSAQYKLEDYLLDLDKLTGFFCDEAPISVPGYFLRDSLSRIMNSIGVRSIANPTKISPNRFFIKNNCFQSVLDDEVVWRLLFSIKKESQVEYNYRSESEPDSDEPFTVVPKRIEVDREVGLKYLVGRTEGGVEVRHRVDRMSKVKILKSGLKPQSLYSRFHNKTLQLILNLLSFPDEVKLTGKQIEGLFLGSKKTISMKRTSENIMYSIAPFPVQEGDFTDRGKRHKPSEGECRLNIFCRLAGTDSGDDARYGLLRSILGKKRPLPELLDDPERCWLKFILEDNFSSNFINDRIRDHLLTKLKKTDSPLEHSNICDRNVPQFSVASGEEGTYFKLLLKAIAEKTTLNISMYGDNENEACIFDFFPYSFMLTSQYGLIGLDFTSGKVRVLDTSKIYFVTISDNEKPKGIEAEKLFFDALSESTKEMRLGIPEFQDEELMRLIFSVYETEVSTDDEGKRQMLVRYYEFQEEEIRKILESLPSDVRIS